MDNSEVLKLIQEQQKWDNIKYCITIIISAIPNILLLWQHYKKNRPNHKNRLGRVRATRAKLDIDSKAKREKLDIDSEAKRKKLDIEEAVIKEEAAHEAALRKMEVGHQSEDQTDFLSSLKEKGTSFFKDKVGSVSEELNKKVDLDKLAAALGKKTEPKK